MADNQRIRLSKKMLRESLIRLLQERSIHKISVREICDGAEINRTTFYKYYGSQYDLLEDLEDQVLKDIEGFLSDGYDSIKDDTLRLTQMMKSINENCEMYRILFNNNLDPEFPEKLFYLPQIRRILTHYLGVQEYLFIFIVNGGYSVIRDWIKKDERESPEVIAAFLNSTIVKLSQFPAETVET